MKKFRISAVLVATPERSVHGSPASIFILNFHFHLEFSFLVPENDFHLSWLRTIIFISGFHFFIFSSKESSGRPHKIYDIILL